MVQYNNEQIEIMAPAGSFESLNAAIKAGADAVYFGVDDLNMRKRAAANFKIADLPKIVKLCSKANVNTYLTLNTLIYDSDIQLMKKICDAAKKANISAVIATDISVIEYARKIGLRVHMSTQTNVSNIQAVKFFSKYSDTIVLARELTLEQIKGICDAVKKEKIKGPNNELVKIEVFIHGALCVSIAGKCCMSLATHNLSANRGECLQNCRRAYRVIDEESGDELVLDNRYVMSPKDLCTIRFLDKILDAGVSVLKIEGRGRGPEYVFKVTKAYKEAVELYKQGKFTQEKAAELEKELEKVFNRGFWQGGYYLGKKLGEWAGTYGSKSTEVKMSLGAVKNYFAKTKIVDILIETGSLKLGDKILITGQTTGAIETEVKEIVVNEKQVKIANKGDRVTIKLLEKAREKDRVFKLIKRSA